MKKIQETAESKLIKEVPIVKLGTPISEVRSMLFRKANNFESLDYIYVVDSKNILKGVTSLKEILQVEDKQTKIEKIMKKDLITVRPSTDQERIVYIALKHELKSVPVVDKEGHFLGVVPYHTILKIFNQEVQEDIFRFGGLYHKVGKEFDTIDAPATRMIKNRIVWLIVGLMGGIIAASIVSFFENILSKYLILAAFIPVLVYMSDAAGTQSETLIVRGIALDPKLSVKKWVKRELIVALTLGLFCGGILSLASLLLWKSSYLIGSIIGLSMFLGIIAGVSISTFLPLVFKKLKIDPAMASGPFATIVSDITTLAIYFSVATFLFLFFKV